MSTQTEDRLLSSSEFAEYVGLTNSSTPAVWRARGTGPRYCKVGTLVRYRLSDVHAWLESRAIDPESND